MFFIDKYSPKNIDEFNFHKKLMKKLEIISKDLSMPNIIFFGSPGVGKKTIIKFFLEMLYDKYVNNTIDSVYTIYGSGNIATDVVVKQSNYHIEIEPHNNNFDKYLVQDIIKKYAKRIQLDIFSSKKSFKTVLINNVNNLSYYAQTSLRRTMEKYSKTCRFIMLSRSISRVIEPLKSRCICIKIEAPTTVEIFKSLFVISNYEQINMTMEDYDLILDKCKGNIKTALWLLEIKKYNKNFEHIYDDAIKELVNLIINFNINTYIKIRDLIYKIMISNIDGSDIIKDITVYLCNITTINFEKICKIVDYATTYEHNIVRGRREIIHIEAFVFNIIDLLF